MTNKFKYIFEHTKLGIAICSAKDNALGLVNPAFARIHGYEPEELIGKEPGKVFAPECMRLISEYEKNGNAKNTVYTDNSISFETTHTKKDGTSVDVAINVTFIKTVNGAIKHKIVTMHDISEQRLSKKRLEDNELFFRSIVENLPGFAFIYKLYHEGKEEFVYASDGILDTYGIDAKTVLSDIAKLRALFIQEDMPNFRKAIEKSAKTMKPFHAEFRINHPKKGVRWLESRSIPSMQNDGSVIWHGITLDITEQKHMQSQLSNQKEFQNTLLTCIAKVGIGVLVMENGRYIYTNDMENAKKYGYDESVLEKKPNFLDTIHPDDREKVANIYKMRLAGKETPSTYELRTVQTDGQSREHNVSVVAIPNTNPLQTIAITQDITDKKAVEKMLHMLTYSINLSSDSIFIIGLKDAKFAYVNETAAKTLDYSKKELESGMGVPEVDPDFGEDIWPTHVQGLRTAGTLHFETRHKTKNGYIYPVEVHAHYFEYDGKEYNLAIARDITEQKRMKRMLEASEEEFRTLAENAQDTIYRYDTNCRRIYVNPAVERLWGMPASELLDKTPQEFTVVSKEDQERVIQSLQQVIKTGEPHNIEVTFIDSNGNKRYFEHNHVPEFNISCEVKSVLSIGRDITEQIKTKKALIDREREFRTLSENSPNIIMRYDKNCKRTYVNHTYSLETGIPINEAVTSSPNEQWSQYLKNVSMTPQEYHAKLQDVLQSGKAAEFTMDWTRISDGEYVAHDIHMVPEFGENGSIDGVLAIGHNITKQKIAERKIEFLAYHDSLTKLPNRVLAKDRTMHEIARAKRNNLKVGVLFIDLDNFKTINDSLGHNIGDMLLKLVAARIKESVREADTVARLGGDEFLIILGDVYSEDDVLTLAEKILENFKHPFCIEKYTLSSSMSIGIAMYPQDDDDFDMLLKKADTAMYKAKESGKNGICFFDAKMNEETIEHLQIQNDIKKALENNEFILHYQPQVDIQNKTINGVEALIRWLHPNKGLIPPMKFIPIAESSGLISEIGEWVIDEACRQAATWHKNNIQISVAVNISAVQLRRGNLEDAVRAALLKHNLAPEFLELELTESIFIQDTDKILSTIKQLKTLGVKLSIDDFGTGYSSLSYLKKFSVDKLKIDQSFVRDILKDYENEAIVRAVVQMAKSLNLKTIAEGVEDSKTLDILSLHGCDEVQGYHFAKPMGVSDFEDFFATFDRP